MNPTGLQTPEARICAIAVAKLRADGWRVVTEVAFWERSIDAVAVKDGLLLGLEAKMAFTKRLESQIFGVSWYTDLAIAVVSALPIEAKRLRAAELGIGLWHVDKSGAVNVLIEPKLRATPPAGSYRERLLTAALTFPESGAGGLPCLKGVGPAQEVQALVDAYRANHPKATWREIFAKVPNHYGSPKGMASALYSNRQRLAYRARMKAQRARRSA